MYKSLIQQWIQRFPFGSPCFFVKGNFLLKSLSTNGFSGSPLVPLWFPFLQKITKKHDFQAFFAVLSIILILSLSSQNKSFSLCIILILSMFNDAFEEPKGEPFFMFNMNCITLSFSFFGGYTPQTPVKFMHKKSNDYSLLPLHMNSMYYLRIITLLYFPLFAGSTLTPKLSASEYLPSIQ